jgi:hypothetical protein
VSLACIFAVSGRNRYFTELNDKLFLSLFEADNAELSYYSDNGKVKEASCIPRRQGRAERLRDRPRMVQTETIKRAGLDAAEDKEFLGEVFKFYDFNLRVA